MTAAGPGRARGGDLAAALSRAPSATAVLQARCDALSHRGLRVRAERLGTADTGAPPPDLDARALLGLAPSDPVRLRHVRLRCGDETLSVAWNWYAPSRLTDAMNRVLATTDIPFGRAVAATHFTRERRGSQTLDPSTHHGMTLQNTAILHRASDNAAIALVVERYDDRTPPARP